MKQPINDLSAKIETYQTEIRASIDRVLKRGWFVLGPEGEQFERSFAEYLGTGYCVGVANGTDALELALKAVGIGPGDLVATVANAGMYTTMATLAIGGQPHFMDVDARTKLVTLQHVALAIDAGAKAIAATHLYGRAIPDIVQIAELCTERGIPLIEDCAQAHGAKWKGKCVGTFGAIGCFSFYPTKNLGALGDGGAVVTADPLLDQRLRRLRQYGWGGKYHVEMEGVRNSRLDEMQAAVLSALLPHLDSANARRREIASAYSNQISSPHILVPPVLGEEDVAHLYVICSPKRDALRLHLHSCGIACDIHYPVPDYRQPLFKGRFGHLHLPNTERLAAEILTLPCYPEMSNPAVDQVIAAVNCWSP